MCIDMSYAQMMTAQVMIVSSYKIVSSLPFYFAFKATAKVTSIIRESTTSRIIIVLKLINYNAATVFHTAIPTNQANLELINNNNIFVKFKSVMTITSTSYNMTKSVLALTMQSYIYPVHMFSTIQGDAYRDNSPLIHASHASASIEPKKP